MSAILITGFGPFPGVAHNISGDYAHELAGVVAQRFPKRRVIAHVLPVEWGRTLRDLSDVCERERPELLLNFGVSGMARGFVIEQVAQNACGSSVDACGAVARGRYVTKKSDPASLASRLPDQHILMRLTALGIPARLSDDAGTYLCNAVFYQSVCLPNEDSDPQVISGFIHMPPLYSRDFSHERALQGGLEIVRVCLGLR
jgi:pyroglutamyl-peptidase